jgi:hypothetical protein
LAVVIVEHGRVLVPVEELVLHIQVNGGLVGCLVTSGNSAQPLRLGGLPLGYTDVGQGGFFCFWR